MRTYKGNTAVKKRRFAAELKRHWQLYLFLLLPVIYVFIFKYLPMAGLVIAFEDYKARKGIFGSPWVGFKWFIKFFESYQFRRVLVNTLLISFYGILAGFPVPIIFALMANCMPDGKVKKIIQGIVTLPHFISTTVMVGIILQIFNINTGLYGVIAQAITGHTPHNILGAPSAFRSLYVWSGVWQHFGWDSIIYTAALAGVDPTYHEAAQLDGANRFQRVIHVDFPTILPTVVIMLILRMGQVMSIGFEKIYLMQNPLNLEASQIISTYVYEVGLSGNGVSNFSLATAIGMFNSIINLILIVTVNKIANKVGETSLW